MTAYSKWTARIALVGLGLIILPALAVIPLNTAKHGAGAVWPIPTGWGHHHLIADVMVLLVYIVLGAIVLIVLVALVWELTTHLWRRSQW